MIVCRNNFSPESLKDVLLNHFTLTYCFTRELVRHIDLCNCCSFLFQSHHGTQGAAEGAVGLADRYDSNTPSIFEMRAATGDESAIGGQAN